MADMADTRLKSADAREETAPPHAADSAAAATRPKTLWREYFESAIVTIVMALFFMTFVAQAAAVPSASMENTIYVGDHFLINKFIFAAGPRVPFLPQRDIRRGDIIVFKYPAPSDPRTDPPIEQYKTFFIKRVIGLPGERVEVRGPRVYINDQPLAEHHVVAARRADKAPLDVRSAPPRASGEPYTVFYSQRTADAHGAALDEGSAYFRYGVAGRPYTVPDDSYFVMGDNRDDSADSRVWGVVPRELVVGRAMFVIWSYDESAPSTGHFLLDFLRNTRWRRTGTLIR